MLRSFTLFSSRMFFFILLTTAGSKASIFSEKRVIPDDPSLLQLNFNSLPSRQFVSNFKTVTLPVSSYQTTNWTDLMPEEDLEALLNPPKYITDIQDGSSEDRIDDSLLNNRTDTRDDRYQQALTSTRVIQDMDGKAIRIPGFVVPLEYDDKQTITQFFLVPWFGACIHMPPPPPNQIILINYPNGFKLDALHTPFWISGVLKTSVVENDMAAAAYIMQMHSFEIYSEN